MTTRAQVASTAIGAALLAALVPYLNPPASRSPRPDAREIVVIRGAVGPDLGPTTPEAMVPSDRDPRDTDVLAPSQLETLTQSQLQRMVRAEARDDAWASGAEAALRAEVVVAPVTSWSPVEYDKALAELQDEGINLRLARSGLNPDQPIIFETGRGSASLPIAATRYLARASPERVGWRGGSDPTR